MRLSAAEGMTSGLRTVDSARDRAGAGVRLLPGRVVLYAWLLAGIPMAVLHVAHTGLHEHTELPPILHWLRDAALAVPLAALAIGSAALLVRLAFAGADPGRARSTTVWVTWAAIAAGIFAVLSVPGNQLHGLLFGAEEEAIGWLEDAILDGSIVLVASLVALVPVALLSAWAARSAEPRQDATQSTRPAPTAPAETLGFPTFAGSMHGGDDR